MEKSLYENGLIIVKKYIIKSSFCANGYLRLF